MPLKNELHSFLFSPIFNPSEPPQILWHAGSFSISLLMFQPLYSIGTNPRRYEFRIHKGKEERRQRYTGNSMAYRKWFRGKKATVDRSAQNLRQYCKWIGKKPEQLKAEYINARNGSFATYEDWKRDTKNSILRFYNEMKEKGYSINAARTMVVGVLAFYSQNCESIRRVTQHLDPIQIPENEFIFNQEILRKCYYYGSPFEKTWLSCAVSFLLRGSLLI
jgi:hypothetical protein